MDKALRIARDAHRKRTGHKKIIVGMNFIECLECKKHAHLGNGHLIVHGRGLLQSAIITPDKF